MKHLVTYRAVNSAAHSSDEHTVITDHPMHLSDGVETFIQEKAKKHGYNIVDINLLQEHRIVIMFIKELNRH